MTLLRLWCAVAKLTLLQSFGLGNWYMRRNFAKIRHALLYPE